MKTFYVMFLALVLTASTNGAVHSRRIKISSPRIRPNSASFKQTDEAEISVQQVAEQTVHGASAQVGGNFADDNVGAAGVSTAHFAEHTPSGMSDINAAVAGAPVKSAAVASITGNISGGALTPARGIFQQVLSTVWSIIAWPFNFIASLMSGSPASGINVGVGHQIAKGTDVEIGAHLPQLLEQITNFRRGFNDIYEQLYIKNGSK